MHVNFDDAIRITACTHMISVLIVLFVFKDYIQLIPINPKVGYTEPEFPVRGKFPATKTGNLAHPLFQHTTSHSARPHRVCTVSRQLEMGCQRCGHYVAMYLPPTATPSHLSNPSGLRLLHLFLPLTLPSSLPPTNGPICSTLHHQRELRFLNGPIPTRPRL
jgi:hypothetical protein